MSTSFNPFQPPETRDLTQPVVLSPASFSEFLTRGLLCAGLFALLTGIERVFPELPLLQASALTGGIRNVLCTGLLLLTCGWLVQCGLPGVWFFAIGVGLQLVSVMAGFLLVVLAVRSFTVSSFGPLLFLMNLVLNVLTTLSLTVAFGWMTERQLRLRVFVVTFLLCVIATGLSHVVITIPRLFAGTISPNILLSIAVSISGSFGLLCTTSALWYVTQQPAKSERASNTVSD